MTRRFALAALLVGVLVAPSAQAHVSVNPREATKGGFAKLAFRVPNERDDAGTTKVSVLFPADHPLASVSVKPVPGWKATVEKAKLDPPVKSHDGDDITEAVSKITWDGGVINPGEFQEFEVSVGPLPEDADSLVFKAVQTYDKGEPVAWIEEAESGGEEPEHPAPVLTLVAGEDEHATAPAAEDGEEEAATGGAEGEVAADPASATKPAELDWNMVGAFAAGGVLLIAALAGVTRKKSPKSS